MNPMQEEKKHDGHQTLQPQYPQTRLQKNKKKPKDAVTMRHAQTCVKYIIDSPCKTSRSI
jgi:phage-related protein